MAFSKISSIILYVVGALSLVVMLFFYVGPATVDLVELENRVEALSTASDIQPEAAPVVDSVAVDTLAATDETMTEADETIAETDSAAAPVVEETAEVEMAPVEEIELKDHMSGWELMVYNRTNYALGWAYILFILTGLAAVIFPLFNLVTNVKALLQTLMIFAGAAVLILVSYFVFAADTTIDIVGYTGTDNSDPGTLKMVGTALFMTYILFGVTILSILYSEIAKIFK